ncbi:hypothetical protein OKJ48_00440 [Streptomyces kunmingensis]|uniref:Secreted protein n=1 Tax=Streptomyces kunmingensis TaxID=68225 RepID=A0ABU6C1Z8_9ACTN|nr:hypothetical protein [Streptomyces kunmingensis]MEB3958732.1 hypothetical protein [Streptomyces kunmingensis]
MRTRTALAALIVSTAALAAGGGTAIAADGLPDKCTPDESYTVPVGKIAGQVSNSVLGRDPLAELCKSGQGSAK